MNRHSLFIAVLMFASGCSQGLPAAADPEKAQTTIVSALEAWKQGGTPDSLPALSPPVYFNDELWSGGIRLMDYHIASSGPNGQGYRFDVDLHLEKRSGEKFERKVGYQVDTSPAIVIVQQP